MNTKSEGILYTISQIEEETAEAKTLTLIPDRPISYASGQSITLEIPVDGALLHRTYSLLSSPYTNEPIQLGIKRIAEGKVSSFLTQNCSVGTVLKGSLPSGRFTIVPDEKRAQTYFFFAGGSGITPILSMIKSILKVESKSKVVLIYANRNEHSIMYYEQLEILQKEYASFRLVHILSQPSATWVGLEGRLDQKYTVDLLERLNPFKYLLSSYFLCGPRGMKEEIKQALYALKIPPLQINDENYQIAQKPIFLTTDTTRDTIMEDENWKGASKITVLDGDKSYSFEVDHTQTILSKANELGMHLPYSCQAGLCTACMVKCISGKINMSEMEGLTIAEVNQGFVLTCVSYAASPEITIEL